MNQIQEVIIIGAGASGIGAAYTLNKLGVPFLILEAQERVGGRMKTTTLDGSVIHHGACYIHDPKEGHPILTVMKELHIQGLPNNYANERYVKQGGTEVPPQEMKEGRKVYEQLRSFIKEQSEMRKEDTDLQTVIDQFFGKNKGLEDKAVRMAKFLMKFDALFEASDLRHLSLKEFSHDRTERDLLPPGGYFRVINAIYQACNPKTLFNKKVVAIDHSQPLVQIRTSDGSTYQARRVICSLPLGVLKKNIVQFEPELPPSHQKAIAGITCGIANKIYLKFQEDFWTKQGDWTFLYSDQPFTFNVVVNEAQTSPNLMCVKVGSLDNVYLFDQPDQAIVQRVLGQLAKYFPLEKMKLRASLVTRWHEDPFSYGSYSTLHPGQSRQSMIELSRAVGGKLWLVGEHCNHGQFAMAHGAFESGQKAASQLAASRNMPRL